MKIIIGLVTAMLLRSVALAQQDPNDPGLPDSVIINASLIDAGPGQALAKIWVVSDDSVIFYNMPISWHDPSGSLSPIAGTFYFPPLTSWDIVFDSVVTSQSFIRMIGYSNADSDLNPPLLTNEQRVNVMTLRFSITPGTLPEQPVLLDTIYDAINGSLAFGLVDGVTEFKPIFRPDSFYIRTGIYENDLLPTEFNLAQNYPNPFNAQTTISYSLAQSGSVTLSIYNIMGQKVATLVDGIEQAGEHKVVWDASEVTSGVYFGRLQTGDKDETRRMELLK
jgi:hypothetical protein